MFSSPRGTAGPLAPGRRPGSALKGAQERLGLDLWFSASSFALLRFFSGRRSSLLRVFDLFIFALGMGLLFRYFHNFYLVAGCHLTRNLMIYGRERRAREGGKRVAKGSWWLGLLLGLVRVLGGVSPLLSYWLLGALVKAKGLPLPVRVGPEHFDKAVDILSRHEGAERRPKFDSLILSNSYIVHVRKKIMEDMCLLSIEPQALRRILEACVTLRGEEHVTRALENPAGVILVTAHVGAFTWLLAWLLLCGPNEAWSRPIAFANKGNPASDGAVDARLEEVRRKLEVRLKEVRVDSSPLTLHQLLRTLEKGGILLMTADGDIYSGRRGRPAPLEIELLGLKIKVGAGAAMLALKTGAALLHVPRRTTGGSREAMLALKTGAALLPIFALRGSRGEIVIEIEPAIENEPAIEHAGGVSTVDGAGRDSGPLLGKAAVQSPIDRERLIASSQEIFDRIEVVIARHPEQWLFWDRIGRWGKSSSG